MPTVDPNTIIMTKASNAPALAVMYAKGLCAHENYMTAGEAAAVTTLKSAFADNKDIRSFDELRYFTGLNTDTGNTSATTQLFQWAQKLRAVAFPEHLTYLGVCSIGWLGQNNDSPARYIIGPNVTTVDKGFTYGIGTKGVIMILRAVNPPTLKASNYYVSNANITLYVPDGSVTAYQNNADWADAVSSILPISQCPAKYLEYHEYKPTSVRGDVGRRSAIITGYDYRIREWSRRQYLTFEAKEDNTTVTWKHTGATSVFMWPVQVSTDGGTTWTEVAPTTEGATLATLNKGQKVLVKRTSNYGFMGSNALYNSFGSDKDVYVYGNIMSLTSGDNFANDVTIRGRYMFGRLFYNMSTLLTDPKRGHIILPATEGFVTYPYVYDSTFFGCSKMTIPSELPATTLGTQPYMSMFRGTTALRGKVVLPATSATDYAYYTMFYESGIEEVEILAGTLGTQSCRMMMRYCPNLKKVTCLATDISAANCTSGWLGDVPATGTFVKAASMTSWPSGASGIPSGWTVQDYS